MYDIIVQVVLFFAVFYCTTLWRNRHIYRQLRHLPGPLNLPLLGSSYVFFGKNSSEIFYTFQQLTATYGRNGSPVQFYLGLMPFIIISKPEHAQIILNSATCLEKPWIYRYTPLEGIFSLPVKTWRRHRRAIQPSFNWAILKTFIPSFQSKVATLLERLTRETSRNEPFDVYGYIAACTLDMVYATTLGIETNIQHQEECEYVNILDELFELVTHRVTNVLLHPEWIYRLTGSHRRETKARKVFFAPAQEVLRRNPILMPTGTVQHGPHNFVYQLYLIAQKGSLFDRNAIEKELNTMIFAGVETTATTMANALQLIAMHPTVQEKLVEEINRVLRDHDQEISIEHLQQLPYMEAVLKEVMRLLPITTILGRKTTAELHLNQLVIPAGVNIAIDVFSIHRNQDHWGEDAHLFVPERFLEGKYDRFAFLGFSAGPRNCIGSRYAWISMKIMLARVLQHFKLETPLLFEDIRIKVAMTLKVVNRNMITISKREQ